LWASIEAKSNNLLARIIVCLCAFAKFLHLTPYPFFIGISQVFTLLFLPLKRAMPPAFIMFMTTPWLTSSRSSSASFQLSAETSTLYLGAVITQNSILASLAFCDFLTSMNASLIHLTPIGYCFGIALKILIH
jgi:hypothetical protein